MSYSDNIRDHLSRVAINEIVCTRDLVYCGSRCAVDQCLYRMVKAGHLIRVGLGVFVKEGSDLPDTVAVIDAKAIAFGRQIASYGRSLAANLGLVEKLDLPPSFCISGGSTSIDTCDERANLYGTCDRKRRLGNTPAGRIIRAWWSMGKDAFADLDWNYVQAMQSQIGRNLSEDAAWMPYWISDRLIRHQ